MIYFDVTKSAGSRHQSGLMRVGRRLREELGSACREVIWNGDWLDAVGRRHVSLAAGDWLLTPELFSESERPGFWEFLNRTPCRTAAVFHDAIPLRFPHITWPQSVARQPEYMRMLGRFDHVFAVSRASLDDLTRFWNWQGTVPRGRVSVLALGADLAGQERVQEGEGSSPAPLFLCLGIVEPRKNQGFLLEVAEELVRRGVEFRLEFVGRINPHFGKPIARRLAAFSRAHSQVRHREKVSDSELLRLWRASHATLFPTLAEGCGLPLLESLWLGVPCVCSDLPVLRENADRGGCVALPVGNAVLWAEELEHLATDAGRFRRLRAEACRRPLPTWRAAAEALLDVLGGGG